MTTRHEKGRDLTGNEVAIIGMAGRFPGARDIYEFWRNLVEGIECTTRITPEDLAAIGVDPAVLSDPDYVSEIFALENPYGFDAEFFGLSPRDAETMDPQQRLFLETAHAALEHAGYDPSRYPGLIGVFGGVGRNSYLIHAGLTRPEILEQVGEYHSLIGNERDFPTTRVSYLLNLRGPSVNVQSACSTSGVAVHLACQSLLAGDCDIALAGGCKVIVPNREGYWYVEGGPLAPEGHVRAFDADAKGMVRGSGAAMLVLKRLDDAIEDDDTIHAVVLGSAVNNDGSAKVGFTAPSVIGQAEVIADAHEAAGVDADSIGYIETHGTGTLLGDPIEVAGLTRAFRESTRRTGYCPIGSVKTNIGHLDAGATAAGIVKTVLAMQHELLPASLNFRRPNPEIDFDSSPFYVNAAPTDWPRGDTPRRAGVSSFGLGGTNSHLVLEEAPVLAPSDAGRPAHLLLLSASSQEALSACAAGLAEHLRAAPETSLADVAYTLQVGRRQLPFRRAVVSSGLTDIVSTLEDPAASRSWSGARRDGAERVVYMFPGGGAQYTHMATGLYETEAAFREALDECAAILRHDHELELTDLLYADVPGQGKSSALTRPALALPVLFAVEYALARLWRTIGVVPAAMIGHSMGEYTAACLAGVFSLRDGLRLVACRGRLFETLPEGAMLSVPLGEDDLTPLLPPGASIAAVNAATQCVASGSVEGIESLEAQLAGLEIEATRIHIAVAAHSPLVEPILGDFEAFVSQIGLSAPTLPFVSNVTGTWISAQEATDPQYWVTHLRQTVRFAAGLATIEQEPRPTLLEVGPGQTLSTFARALRGPGNGVVASLRHPREQIDDQTFFLQALGQLWIAGVPIAWEPLYENERRRRVPLPTYPFERRPFHLLSEDEQRRGRAGQPGDARHQDPRPSGGAGAGVALSQPAHPTTPSQPTNETPEMSTQQSHADSSPIDRKARILQELHTVLSRLSGLDPATLDPSRTFLELGFDSLFLAQANNEMKKVFKVKLTTRQLMEKHPTLAALTEHLDAVLPADRYLPAPPSPAAAGSPGPSPGVAAAPRGSTGAFPVATAAAGASTGVVQGLIEQQLRLMQEQLAVLRAFGADPGSAALPTLPAASDATAAAGPRPPHTDAAEDVPAVPDASSPWQPVRPSADSELTPEQQRHVAALIEQVQNRTPNSKQQTQQNRRRLADPRTVQGFKRQWKEIVYPVVSDRAEGSRIWDVDGNPYIDLVNGYGVNFLGHSPSFVLDAVREQIGKTVAIGPQTPLAGEVAALICELTGMDRAALCNTGSEAVLAAIRTARTVTGRTKLLTFAGHYHGIFDEVLVKGMGTGARRGSVPIAPGIPRQKVADVIVAEYGNLESLDIIRENAADIALVMVEPVRSRNPDLQPREFLHALRATTAELGIPLLFDEMVTGFRSHPGGAQAVFDVRADLATYGKVVGGGFPIGVVTGSSEYMDALDGGQWSFGDDSVPEADMTWFAGTFVRHPVALAAARATLSYLKEKGPALQEELNRRTTAFAADLNDHFRVTGAPIWIEHFSSFFMLTFTSHQPYSALLFYHLHNRGVLTYEGRPAFFTLAHSDQDLADVAAAFKESAAELQAVGLMSRSDERPAQVAASRVIVRPDGVKEVPLTDPQKEVWIATEFGAEASSAFNLSIKLLVDGDLDLDSMKTALQGLVDTHEVLRATIDEDGEVQRILPALDLDVGLVDLTELPDGERAARADALELNEIKVPYDLHHGPLVRARIVKLDESRWRVLFFVHHIVADGWSCGVLSRDLGRLYSRARGTEKPPAKGVMQFSEYVRHLQGEEQRLDRQASEDFWLGEYDTLPPPLDVPADRPRPAIKTYGADRVHLRVEPSLVRRLKEAASKQGATLFAFGFAAFDAFLHRLSGQDDIAVGFDLAGQALIPDQDLVGHCVSFLPLRMQIDGSLPFSELLARMRTKLFDVIDNQHYTYGSLLQKLRVPPDPSRLPLVSVSFNLDPSSLGVEFAGLEVISDSIPRQFENNDLFVNLVQQDDGSLELQCTYNRDLFEEETVRRRMAEFVTLLADAAERPETPISALRWLPESERDRLVNRWNQTSAPLPHTTLHQLIAEQAAKSPEAVAVVAETGVAKELTYGELERRADALAARLQSLGVQQDTPVAVCMERSAELVVGLLAVLKAGGAYVPVDPGYPERRKAFMLRDSGAQVLLVQQGVAAGECANVLEVDAIWETLTAGAPEPLASPASLAYVIYTSGSTGQPKGAMVEHRSIVNRLLWMRNHLGMGADDVVLQKTPYSFDVSVWELFLPLLSGSRLVMARPEGHRDPDYLARAIREHGVTTIHFVPSLLHAFVADADLSECRALRRVICSGEALSPSLRDRFLAKLDVELYNLYGPTEAAVDVTVHRCAIAEPAWCVPIGRPIANTRLYVLDAGRSPVPVGVPGELYIGGVQVARGYLNRPDLTAERFSPDHLGPEAEGRLYRTGDSCRYLSSGDIEFLGRLDHQVKVRGFRIELGEIETALEALDGVKQAVVVVQQIGAENEALAAYLTGSGGTDLDPVTLRTALAETLPDYMVPQHLLVLDAIPLTTNGKVDREALPDIELPQRNVRRGAAPSSDTERRLAAIWQEVLGVDEVVNTDNFFELGGHSILAARVATRVRRDLGMELPLRKLFTAPTLGELAAVIETMDELAQMTAGDEDDLVGEEVFL